MEPFDAMPYRRRASTPRQVTSSLPELPRGEPRPFRHRRQFGPDDIGIDRGLADPRAEAAIAAGNDVVAADQIGGAGGGLRDEVRTLAQIRLRLDDARDDGLALRQFDALEQRPFMRVAWVRRLERDRARPRQEDDVDDVGERHVTMMRPLVIAPAQMHSRLFRRDLRQRMVQRLDMQPRPL